MTPAAELPDPHLDPVIAAGYDQAAAARFDRAELEPTVDLLADLAGDGPVLELAIGTGRVALPLAERGIDVHGIDLSEPMVAQLRAKPGGAAIPISIGDMTTTVVDGAGSFSLVYLVFNTIGNLRTQSAQAASFVNAARHLAPGGRFLVEVGVSALALLPAGQTTRIFASTGDYIGFDRIVDATEQRAESNHWRVDGERVHRNICPYRWVTPAELDLMANLAGFEFESRWADWRPSAFDRTSRRQIAVWAMPKSGNA